MKLMQETVKQLQIKCNMYENMIINLAASSQALWETLVAKGLLEPQDDSSVFYKSHVKNVALMDQFFAKIRDQAAASG